MKLQRTQKQAGFTEGYSTMDHIHVINQVREKCTECYKPLYMTFIDYEKPFDSGNTAAVMYALNEQGIEETYLRLHDDIYGARTGRIIFHKQSDKFSIRKEVREGDTISPKLFTACLESVFRKLDWEHLGLRINGEYLSHLRFADDKVLLSEFAELQKTTEEIQSRASPWC